MLALVKNEKILVIVPAYCQRRWFFNKNVIHLLLLLLLPDGDLVSREKPLGCDPST